MCGRREVVEVGGPCRIAYRGVMHACDLPFRETVNGLNSEPCESMLNMDDPRILLNISRTPTTI
jgi:hypothetical protein